MRASVAGLSFAFRRPLFLIEGVLIAVFAERVSHDDVGIDAVDDSQRQRANVTVTIFDLVTSELRYEAGRLAGLFQLADPADKPMSEDMVRKQIAHEAAHLRFRDPVAASLLRNFARRVPSPWLFPHEGQSDLNDDSPHAFGDVDLEPADNSNVFTNTSSDETVVNTDSDGHSVTKTKHCENGLCEEDIEENQLPSGKFSGDDVSNELKNVKIPRVSDFIARFGQRLRTFRDRLGSGVLNDVFGNNSSRNGDSAEIREEQHDRMSSSSNGESTSSSVSTETIVDNDNKVTRRQTCKDGHCEEEVVNSARWRENDAALMARKVATVASILQDDPIESVQMDFF
eukprot:TRINITY_DN74572_c0_g1_i1.p1 TRINITY_DN74572_c0_g1~~TRINITY_DN74572_c0_g1_i1.p1  ORF type:complete len:342 (+),score=51.61 TRINITY_DN74572_c0_g1_i1:71-1096(+)